MLKRGFDLVVSVFALLILAPALLLMSIAIQLDSQGPVLFRQARVGRHGRLFQILKFRTMRERPAQGDLQITVGNDPYITGIGTYLRRYKLDELPQLVNVIRGDMSLVGPRPEVPRYVAHYTAAEQSLVLSVRPGITDNASIEFRNESDILAQAQDAEKAYLELVLPVKIRHYIKYVKERSFIGDLVIIMKTVKVILLG